MPEYLNGANLIAVAGDFGSGKSLKLVELSLEIAEIYKKNLVCSFSLNETAVRRYCKYKRYNWFYEHGKIFKITLDLPDDDKHKNTSLEQLFDRKDTVVVGDELGVFLNSRNWKWISSKFLQKLFQIRRLNIHLITAFQFVNQVDCQFRQVVQHWILCESNSNYSKELKGPKIWARKNYHYDAKRFFKLEQSTATKAAWVRPVLLAKRREFSILPLNWLGNELLNLGICLKYAIKAEKIPKGNIFSKYKEQLLFDCFDSFELLGEDEKVEKLNSKKTKEEEVEDLVKSIMNPDSNPVTMNGKN